MKTEGIIKLSNKQKDHVLQIIEEEIIIPAANAMLEGDTDKIEALRAKINDPEYIKSIYKRAKKMPPMKRLGWWLINK